MPAPKVDDFFADPKHKEDKDFLNAVIDARVKEIAEQYETKRKQKKTKEDDEDDESTSENGSFFDHLFGGKKK